MVSSICAINYKCLTSICLKLEPFFQLPSLDEKILENEIALNLIIPSIFIFSLFISLTKYFHFSPVTPEQELKLTERIHIPSWH